jgi:hypothetical protein
MRQAQHRPCVGSHRWSTVQGGAAQRSTPCGRALAQLSGLGKAKCLAVHRFRDGAAGHRSSRAILRGQATKRSPGCCNLACWGFPKGADGLYLHRSVRASSWQTLARGQGCPARCAGVRVALRPRRLPASGSSATGSAKEVQFAAEVHIKAQKGHRKTSSGNKFNKPPSYQNRVQAPIKATGRSCCGLQAPWPQDNRSRGARLACRGQRLGG